MVVSVNTGVLKPQLNVLEIFTKTLRCMVVTREVATHRGLTVLKGIKQIISEIKY